MTAEEIMEFRKSLGVSQDKFAHMLGTTTNTVNRWERGHAKASRLYVKEIKELMRSSGSYVSRRKES